MATARGQKKPSFVSQFKSDFAAAQKAAAQAAPAPTTTAQTTPNSTNTNATPSVESAKTNPPRPDTQAAPPPATSAVPHFNTSTGQPQANTVPPPAASAPPPQPSSQPTTVTEVPVADTASPLNVQATLAQAEKTNLAKTMAVAQGWRPEELMVAIERNGDEILRAFGINPADTNEVAVFKNDLQNYRDFYIQTANNFRHPELIDHLNDPADPNLQIEISRNLNDFAKEVNELYTTGPGQKNSALANYFEKHAAKTEIPEEGSRVVSKRVDSRTEETPTVVPGTKPTETSSEKTTEKKSFSQEWKNEKAEQAESDVFPEEEDFSDSEQAEAEEEIPAAPPEPPLTPSSQTTTVPPVTPAEQAAEPPQAEQAAPLTQTSEALPEEQTSESPEVTASSTPAAPAAASSQGASFTPPPAGGGQTFSSPPLQIPNRPKSARRGASSSSSSPSMSPPTADQVPTSQEETFSAPNPAGPAEAAALGAAASAGALGDASIPSPTAGSADFGDRSAQTSSLPQPGTSFRSHLPGSSEQTGPATNLDLNKKSGSNSPKVSPKSRFGRLTSAAKKGKRPSLRPKLGGRAGQIFRIVRSIINIVKKLVAGLIKLITFFISHPILGAIALVSLGTIAVVSVIVIEDSSNTVQMAQNVNQAPLSNTACSPCLAIAVKTTPTKIESPDAPIQEENRQFVNFSFTIMPNSSECKNIKLSGVCSAAISIACKNKDDSCPTPGNVEYEIPPALTNPTQGDPVGANVGWNYRLPTDPEEAFTADGDLSVPFCNALMRKLNVTNFISYELNESISFNLNEFFPSGYPLPIGNDYRLTNTVQIGYFADSTHEGCGQDVGPSKGHGSICVGDCPAQFCWPVRGNIGQLPFNPGGSHHDGDSIDIHSNNNKPIYAPIAGTYTYGYSYQDPNNWKYNNGMPGCYATVPFEHNGKTYKLRFVHMPYENNVAPGSPGGLCKEGSYILQVGDLVGKVNSTGNSSGAHLHFGITGNPSSHNSAATSLFTELFFGGITPVAANRSLLQEAAQNNLCENQ